MSPFLALLIVGPGEAHTEYFGIYHVDPSLGVFAGSAQAGHVVVVETPDAVEGKPATRRASHTEVTQVMGGVRLKGTVDDQVWIDVDDHPLREILVHRYPKNTVRAEATFGAATVEVDLDDGGKRSHRSVPLPKEEVLDDPVRVIRDRLKPGGSLTFATFSAETATFETATMACVGPSSFQDGPWRKVPATLSNYVSGGEKARFYTDAQGVLVRTELPGSQTYVYARPKEIALSGPSKELPDLLLLNSLHTSTPLADAVNLRRLRLRFEGMDLSKIPSDELQTVTKDGDGWVVDLHPKVSYSPALPKIGENVAGLEAWLKPGENLPCDDPAIRAAARKAVGERTTAVEAAVAIRKFVSGRMKATMEFGDVRDAADILRHPHGKCTEYAVLTTALLRAAGIPARIVSGLVTGDGTFFYHAWTESWTGKDWAGIDAALEMDALPACYIKLAQGDAKDGFRIVYPSDPSEVRIDVLPTSP